jgi:acetyl-CoA acetyltransferase
VTQDAVIGSYARTGLTRSFRGRFNATHGAVFGGALITAARAPARLEGDAERIVAGGLESISCVAPVMNQHMLEEEEELKQRIPAIYWPMLATAEPVAQRLARHRSCRRSRTRTEQPL